MFQEYGPARDHTDLDALVHVIHVDARRQGYACLAHQLHRHGLPLSRCKRVTGSEIQVSLTNDAGVNCDGVVKAGGQQAWEGVRERQLRQANRGFTFK